MGFATSILSDIGSPIIETALAITATRQAITVLAPKKTIEIHNAVANAVSVYYGDVTVTGTAGAAPGIPILPGETKIFASVENGFKVYLVCNTAETATCILVSYKGR
jgi:hypothetical protein